MATGTCDCKNDPAFMRQLRASVERAQAKVLQQRMYCGVLRRARDKDRAGCNCERHCSRREKVIFQQTGRKVRIVNLSFYLDNLRVLFFDPFRPPQNPFRASPTAHLAFGHVRTSTLRTSGRRSGRAGHLDHRPEPRSSPRRRRHHLPTLPGRGRTPGSTLGRGSRVRVSQLASASNAKVSGADPLQTFGSSLKYRDNSWNAGWMYHSRQGECLRGRATYFVLPYSTL